MKPVLSIAEMRRVDAETTADIDRLMDSAGYAVALAAADFGAGYGSKVSVLCGKGNNGGDGYIAAAYLADRGATVTAHVVGNPLPNTPADRAAKRAQRHGVRIRPIAAPSDEGFVIDAVVGTGFTGSLSPEVAAFTATSAVVIAVDIPSGLNGDDGTANGPVFDAEATVVFHARKTGHLLGRGPDLCGEVRVVDIGLTGGDPAMFVFEDSDVVVPSRARTAHKWSSGAVATIGGMPGLTGAALLAARAALAAGSGVSNLVTQTATSEAYLAAVPEIPTMETTSVNTTDEANSLLERLRRFDVIIAGPGLEPASGAFVRGLIAGFDGALVLDAGALNAINPGDLSQRTGPTILTPHAGEFERLTGVPVSHDAAVLLSQETGSIVVLKGNPTLVVGDRTFVVTTGGPELATIGTGDVLAGMIGAFVARSSDPLMSAASAAHLHGVAGQVVADLSAVTAGGLLNVVGPTVAAYTD